MAPDFFFNVDDGAVMVAKTDWLSPKTNTAHQPWCQLFVACILSHKYTQLLVSSQQIHSQKCSLLFRAPLNAKRARAVQDNISPSRLLSLAGMGMSDFDMPKKAIQNNDRYMFVLVRHVADVF
jgi:hypothetical protein